MGKSLVTTILKYLVAVVLFSMSMEEIATAYDGVSFWGVMIPSIRFVATITGAWYVWDRIGW